MSDLTTRALLVTRGVPLRKHGKSPSRFCGTETRKKFCAPRRSDLCDAAHTPIFKFDQFAGDERPDSSGVIFHFARAEPLNVAFQPSRIQPGDSIIWDAVSQLPANLVRFPASAPASEH